MTYGMRHTGMALLLRRTVQTCSHCLRKKNSAGYELYSKRFLEYARNGWNEGNDLVLKIGFDSSGLYDIGQEKGYGTEQDAWIKGKNQSIFDAKV